MKHFVPMVALLAVGCSGPRVDVMGRYGQFDVDGQFAATAGPITSSNTAAEVGIVDDDGYFGGRADFKWGMPHLIVSGQATDHSGSGVLSSTIDLDGTTITAGTAVDTTFDLGLYNALLMFDFLPTDVFELGLGFGIGALDLDAQFVGGGNTIATDETLPVPLIAACGAVQLSRFELAALLSGMSGSVDGNDLTYLDLDAFGRVGLIRPDDRGRISLLVGYRYLDIDLEYEDEGDNVLFDMEFQGPYAGLEVSF